MSSHFLEDPSYLLSTIQTVTDSLHERSSTSIHDLLDAYATFSSRLRSCCQLLAARDTLPPALSPLKVHKNNFVQALRRDVCLALVDPLSTFSHSSVSLDQSAHINFKGDARQYARDSSALCHHAICVLGSIFRYPAFHLVFPERDLSILFGDVLDIALADQLPGLNAAKTYSLSLWILTCHRLPVAVLDSRQDDICSALQRSLIGPTQPCNVVLDGLKAISHTMEYHPSEFLDPLSPLLPHVIRNLHCQSSELRLHASIVLGKFASALIHQTELSVTKWQTISHHITSFLESYCDESQAASRDTSFLHMVRTAFSTESHTHPRYAPTWILAVLASFIVLCGPTLYTKPTVLHFILQALAMALTHKRSIVRALHPHVWRCFVWTFSQMLLNAENVEPTLISSAFYAIKQEVSGGIGVALANVLLSDRMSAIRLDDRGDRVSQALSVVKAMVRSECSHTRREGFMFLQALVSDARVGHQTLQEMYEMPALLLLSGAVISAEWDSLPSIIRSIPKVPVSVHWLEKTEIAQHYKILLEIWKDFATKGDRKDVDSALVGVWLSILLVCSHQLECGQHGGMITEVPKYTAAIIVEFLPSVTTGDWEPDWGSWDVRDQLYSLTFIDQLWSAMQKVFINISLAESAAHILASILQYAFHVLDLGVRTLWGRLCVSLMTAASPSFLRDTQEPITSQLVIRSQRELWGVVATSLSSSSPDLDWKDLVKFLSIPICVWVLSKPELEAWEALLRDAITLSGDPAMVTEHFILRYFQGDEVETWESIIVVLGFLLTYTHEDGNTPPHELLSVVDICLATSYNRARCSPEALTHSLELLSVIRHMIVSTPGEVMDILQALCSSLCLWIEDHNEVMSDDEFNSVAVSLYCETLEALKPLPLSIQSLQDTENFLASAFSRIPTPAIAPFTFEKFWRETYHGHTQFCDYLPVKIKSCLRCFVAAYGGDLADGLSSTTESQSQNISNGSEVYFFTSHQYQYSGESCPQAGPPSTSMNAEVCAEVSGVEVGMRRQQQVLMGQDDTSFLIPSPEDDTFQPIALRQLQEYSSQMVTPSLNVSERSTSNPRLLLSPIIPSRGAMPNFLSPEKDDPVTSYAPSQKRRLADSEDTPQKRSRTSRDTLRSMRKLASEPASRDVTPVGIPRMHSVPLKKRKLFDGVHVPTLREVLGRKTAHGVDTTRNMFSAGQRPVSIPQSPSARDAQRKSRSSLSPLPSSIGSDDDLDWENFRVDVTASEADIDQSLLNVSHISPPWTSPTFATREPDDKSYDLPGSSSPKAISQGGSSSSAITRPSLRRVKTTSTRLEALRGVYSSVANGASQIPMSELLQATRLVHKIGAVLTEQMGKKMGDSDPG